VARCAEQLRYGLAAGLLLSDASGLLAMDPDLLPSLLELHRLAKTLADPIEAGL
jgi:hypothetical protein